MYSLGMDNSHVCDLHPSFVLLRHSLKQLDKESLTQSYLEALDEPYVDVAEAKAISCAATAAKMYRDGMTAANDIFSTFSKKTVRNVGLSWRAAKRKRVCDIDRLDGEAPAKGRPSGRDQRVAAVHERLSLRTPKNHGRPGGLLECTALKLCAS